MARLLVVTNDFPPRPGGIQSFVGSVVERLPPDEVVVLTSRWRGAERWDGDAAYHVVREPTSVLLPTPGVRRRAVDLLRRHGCSDVWFGAAAPLGLLAGALRAAGARRIVASTHGHEIGWARLPGGGRMVRRIARDVDVLTYLGEFTRHRLVVQVGRAAGKLTRLAPGVDTEQFSPTAADGTAVRAELGLAGRPVVVCVSRLMRRKGQDTLIRALPAIRRQVPEAALLCVGGGPRREGLRQLAEQVGVADSVVLTGSVPTAELPAHYLAGDVFAMPCRSRLAGLEAEGLGMVFLEAAACGLPVVVGNSGGAVEAVLPDQTGRLVEPRSVEQVADAVVGLLANPAAAAAMGRRGREWVSRDWSWERTMAAFHAAFEQPPSHAD